MPGPETGPDPSSEEGQREFSELPKGEQDRLVEAAHIDANEMKKRMDDLDWGRLTILENLAFNDPKQAQEVRSKKQKFLESIIGELDKELEHTLSQIREALSEPGSNVGIKARNLGLSESTVDKIGLLTNSSGYETKKRPGVSVLTTKETETGVILGCIRIDDRDVTVLLTNTGLLRQADPDETIESIPRPEYYKEETEETEGEETSEETSK
ncbi:MAG: hypothetical protein ABH837_00780 [bacterium]